MNRMLEYKRYFLQKGLWHAHTALTDGKNTVAEMCQAALDKGYELLAFTEHVRKALGYSFNELAAEVMAAREAFPLTILLGAEAKVLDTTGELDISDEVYDQCQLVLGAFHGFPEPNREAYMQAALNMISSGRIDAWAHPLIYPRRKQFTLTLEDKEALIEACAENQVCVELSLRYKQPDTDFYALAKQKGVWLYFGCDAHSVEDVLNKTPESHSLFLANLDDWEYVNASGK